MADPELAAMQKIVEVLEPLPRLQRLHVLAAVSLMTGQYDTAMEIIDEARREAARNKEASP